MGVSLSLSLERERERAINHLAQNMQCAIIENSLLKQSEKNIAVDVIEKFYDIRPPDEAARILMQ